MTSPKRRGPAPLGTKESTPAGPPGNAVVPRHHDHRQHRTNALRRQGHFVTFHFRHLVIHHGNGHRIGFRDADGIRTLGRGQHRIAIAPEVRFVQLQDVEVIVQKQDDGRWLGGAFLRCSWHAAPWVNCASPRVIELYRIEQWGLLLTSSLGVSASVRGLPSPAHGLPNRMAPLPPGSEKKCSKANRLLLSQAARNGRAQNSIGGLRLCPAAKHSCPAPMQLGWACRCFCA